MRNIIYITLCIILLQCGQAAPMQKYPVTTNKENVACWLQPFTQHQTGLLCEVSSFDYYDRNGEQHPIHEIPDEFIAVKVCITNNSQDTISIKKYDYIDPQDNFFINKSEVLNRYPNTTEINETLRKQMIAVPAVALFTHFFVFELLEKHVDYMDITKWVVDAGALIYALGTGLRIINNSNKPEKKLYKKISGPTPNKSGIIQIPPKSSFVDFLFTTAKYNPNKLENLHLKVKT